MANHGLVAPLEEGEPGDTPYAFLCYDKWPAFAGNEETAAYPEGDRFSLRETELLWFVLAGVLDV